MGYHSENDTLRAGDTLTLRLYWLARKTPSGNDTVFVHVARPDDSDGIGQDDAQPVLDQSDTGRWDPDELEVDERQLTIAKDAAPGTYHVLAGFYTRHGHNLRDC